jgi:SAM-dependent methyltransferase
MYLKFTSDLQSPLHQENHRHPNGPWPLMLAKVQSLNLPSGAKVLDLASGPGEPAITLAKALPEFSVTSTDISEDMVATALNKGTDLSNFLAVVADSQDLSAFESNSVDVCTCCYGFMFPQVLPRCQITWTAPFLLVWQWTIIVFTSSQEP